MAGAVGGGSARPTGRPLYRRNRLAVGGEGIGHYPAHSGRPHQAGYPAFHWTDFGYLATTFRAKSSLHVVARYPKSRAMKVPLLDATLRPADTAGVESEDWPPLEGEYFPRRIMQRLEALKGLTQVRSASWVHDTAEVTVWPYSDEIVAAVRDRLAPLEARIEPQDWLPRRLSGGAQ